jgi:hypothetical protein
MPQHPKSQWYKDKIAEITRLCVLTEALDSTFSGFNVMQRDALLDPIKQHLQKMANATVETLGFAAKG